MGEFKKVCLKAQIQALKLREIYIVLQHEYDCKTI